MLQADRLGNLMYDLSVQLNLFAKHLVGSRFVARSAVKLVCVQPV